MIDEIRLEQLSTRLWQAISKEKKQPEIVYDNDIDTLFMYFVKPKDGAIATHYLDQNVSFLFSVADKEIIGLSIEGFERSFASKYGPANLWRMSATGAKLEGMKEITFCVVREEEIKQSFPIRVERDIQLKPEFAFA